MTINPTNPSVTKTSASVNTTVAVTSQTAASTTASTMWERDAYSPTKEDSPYLNYNAAGVNDVALATVAENGKSIYDFTPTQLRSLYDQVSADCAALDTTGMTKGEIYNSIEAIFVQHLGKNFREPTLLGMSATYSDSTLQAIHRGEISFPIAANGLFSSELKKHDIFLGPFENAEAIREARGYKGLSDSEIRTAVRKQYPEVMTLRDCILMAHEMWDLGLEKHHLGNMRQCFDSIMGLDTFNKRESKLLDDLMLLDKLYTTLLDIPADYQEMTVKLNAFAVSGYTGPRAHNMDSLLEKTLSMFSKKELYSKTQSGKSFSVLQELYDTGFLKSYGT